MSIFGKLSDKELERQRKAKKQCGGPEGKNHQWGPARGRLRWCRKCGDVGTVEPEPRSGVGQVRPKSKDEADGSCNVCGRETAQSVNPFYCREQCRLIALAFFTSKRGRHVRPQRTPMERYLRYSE